MEVGPSRLEQVLRIVGLSAPTWGRAHYFASRGAVALAVAVLTMLAGYGLSTVGAITPGSTTGAVTALTAGASYALSIRCLIGFWSVPSNERRAEGLLRSTHSERSVLVAGWAAAALGSVALAGLVLAMHLG